MDQMPVQTEWFMSAERAGAFCLRWLLAHHSEALGNVFFERIYHDTREQAIVFFHTMIDQLLPPEEVPTPPNTGVTEHSTEYYKKIATWGLLRDVGGVSTEQRPNVLKLESSQIHKASVFHDVNFHSDEPYSLGEMGVLLLGLRGIMDPSPNIRLAAFKLVRFVMIRLLKDSIGDMKQREMEESVANTVSNRKRTNAPPLSTLSSSSSSDDGMTSPPGLLSDQSDNNGTSSTSPPHSDELPTSSNDSNNNTNGGGDDDGDGDDDVVTSDPSKRIVLEELLDEFGEKMHQYG